LQAGLLCCRCCGRYFRQTEKTAAAAVADAAVWHCVGCLSSQPSFDFARAVGPYAGILREAIHRFKYLGKLSLAEPLGKLMAAAVREEFLRTSADGQTGSGAAGAGISAAGQTGSGAAGISAAVQTGSGLTGVAGTTRDAAAGATSDDAAGISAAGQPGVSAAGYVGRGPIGAAGQEGRVAACVVPVPLHPQRLRERGFNQAELLAEVVARELKLEFAPRMLARGKYTPSQTRLSREERQLNLRGAFVLSSGQGQSGSSKPADLASQDFFTNKATLTNQAAFTNKAALTNQAVLIVDDVLTTGSTGAECARVLREVTCGPIVLVTTATGGNFKEDRFS
jgi:predicted amidophosphoribosyltransferase